MIATLNRTCDETRKHIHLAKQETAPMLEEASTLMARKYESETKQEVLKTFNKHFIIPDDDLSTLTSSAEPVNDRFFVVLDRVKQIHKDCEVLLGSENQRLGLELMEQTTRNLDAAYRKLYNWIQREFKNLDLEDPHISGSIRRSLRVLAERPSLFQNCLDFFADARERTLSDAFQAALTEAAGGPDRLNSAKPIEFSTHDLLRYLGDMLAWVHSAAVSEKESLEGLFISDGDEIAKGIKAGKDSEPWSRLRVDGKDPEDEAEMAFDGRKALNDLVNRDLGGVCRTLRQRVEVAVRNSEDPLLVFRAVILLRFYQDMFSKFVGHESALSAVMRELGATTFVHFEHLLQDEAESISDDVAPPNMSIPSFMTAALDRATALLKMTTDPSTTEIDMLLKVALLPFLGHCIDMAEEISDPIQRAVFQLNQHLAIQTKLAPLISASTQSSSTVLAPLADTAGAMRTELVEQQHRSLLDRSGLVDLLASIPTGSQSPEEEEHEAAFAKSQLSTAAATLDAFLPTALSDALANLQQLSDRRLATLITAEAIERFCKDFERVEDAVERIGDRAAGEASDDNDDDDMEDETSPGRHVRDYFPRTSAEIRVLLT